MVNHFRMLYIAILHLNTLIASVLNGQQFYKQYILVGMFSVFISTMFMILLIVAYNLKGALIATAINRCYCWSCISFILSQ